MLLRICLLFALLFVCNFFLKGQSINDFQQVSKHVFSDGVTKGPLHKFRHVFETDPVSLKLFNKFNRTRRTQVIVNLAGMGISVAGYFVADAVANDLKETSSDGVVAIVALGILSIGPSIMILSNPILGTVKHHRKKKLLSRWDAMSYNMPNDIELRLSYTQNGLGVIINF